MRGLYKMVVDCGRRMRLEALFISTEQRVKILIDSEICIYFREALGKHSEVFGSIEEKEIKLISNDETLLSLIDEDQISIGPNPFRYGFIDFKAEDFGLDFSKDRPDSVGAVIDLLIKTGWKK